jgi:hypothetical protein
MHCALCLRKSSRPFVSHQPQCDFTSFGCEWPRKQGLPYPTAADLWPIHDEFGPWFCTKCYNALQQQEVAHSQECRFRVEWERAGRPSLSKIKHQQGGFMREFVKLYRDGDSVAIQTNTTDESQFVRQASLALGEALENPAREGRADALLALWIPQIVDICASLRGYKAPLVDQQVVRTAGRIYPSEALIVAASEGNGVTKVLEQVEA